MSTQRRDLVLDKDDVTELSQIARYANNLEQIGVVTAEFQPGRNFSNLVKAVAEKTGLASRSVEAILNSLNTFVRLRAAFHLSDEELIDQITTLLESYADATESATGVERWNAAKDKLLAVLGTIGADHPIVVARKLERLAYSHQLLFSEARIITELRPVFNDAGTTILQGMIVNTLVIDFYEGGRTRRLEIGVDSEDLAELRRVAQRAESKSKVLKESLNQVPWHTFIFPDEEILGD
jgi:hypothetical protein